MKDIEIMEDYIGFNEVKDKFDTNESIIFSLIQRGLVTPFNSLGGVVKRPDITSQEYYNGLINRKKHLKEKLKKLRVDPLSETYAAFLAAVDPSSIETEEAVAAEIIRTDKEINGIDASSIGDLFCWSGIEFPRSKEKWQIIIDIIQLSLYSEDELNNVKELLAKRKPVLPGPAIIDGSNRKNYLPKQLHKFEARRSAEEIWAIEPNLTIADMIRRSEINKSYEGKTYRPKTLREWVCDLCPNPRRGRPKKK